MNVYDNTPTNDADFNYQVELLQTFPKRCFDTEGNPCRLINEFCIQLLDMLKIGEISEQSGLELANERSDDIQHDCRFGLDKVSRTCGKGIIGYVHKPL